jgi:hypothetical protein
MLYESDRERLVARWKYKKMKNEAEFKSLFKRSVRAAKGFSISLAAPMLPGIPDLYVVVPGYIPVLLEAKWLGEIKREKFSRKPQFTSMQLLFLDSCHSITPYSAMGLLGFYYLDTLYACLVAYGTPMFYSFSSNFLTDCAYSALDKTTKGFKVLELFAGVPIPKIERQLKQTGSLYDTAGNKADMAI